jgi:RimK family alpha-L-glutamate ligase
MRLGVLAPEESWHFRDLCRAGQASGHEFVSVAYSRIVADLPGRSVRSGETNLLELDALLTRAMPAGSLEQVVFRMDALYVAEQEGLRCVNSPKAVEASVDKYLSLARISRAGLPIPDTLVCENHRDVGEAFEQLGGDVILKPIFGSEGRGLVRTQERELAERYYRFIEEIGGILYLQRFIEMGGEDTRVLVIGENCFAMRRRGTRDWRSNVSQGGKGEPVELPSELKEIAMGASRAVDAEFAGVDIGRDQQGNVFVLEVNAAPGWRGISSVLEIDIAQSLLSYIETALSR